MRILGIVAEYDPFHRGHERHLRLAKEAVRPDFTLVALSGCVKQRGEWAMLSPYDRAECALAAGADAVFALPAVWTCRDAEHYALGAVSMLRELGATHLAFGAEAEALSALRRIAEILENPEEPFRDALKAHLSSGCGYPRALSRALETVQPGAGRLLEQPNNTLAICYLRAILRLGAGIEPVLIPRGGSYHAEEINPAEPSASAIRGALTRGDYGRARAAVTERSAALLRSAFLAQRIPDPRKLDTMMISCLRRMNREEAAELPDVSEGLEDRLLKAARFANTREQLLDAVSGRRYPRARISRICAAAMLGLTRERIQAEPLPRRAVLLGLRNHPEMTGLWREKRELITTAWEDEADLRAWRIRAQAAGLPDTLPQTERVRKEG